MAIQNRRGADADFDSHKMLPGELAVTTDGSRKVYATFAPGDSREVAFKDQVPIVGNITPAEVQTAVDNYLTENPVHAGATEEQAKQIELNRQNIETNKKEIDKANANIAQIANSNLFINGNFQIWQRGEEFTVAINEDGTYGGYKVTADKWIVGAWGSNVAHVYKSDKGLAFSREQAEPIYIFQQLEEETLKSILGKPLTMSYGIEDATGTYQEYRRNIVLDENIEIEPFAIATEYFGIELQMGCTILWAKLEVGELKTPCIPDSKDVIICKLERNLTYSKEEICTGETWIDGKPIYRKTFVFTDTLSSPTTEIPHNIENVDKIWVDTSNSYFHQGSSYYPVTYAQYPSGLDAVTTLASTVNMVFNVQTSWGTAWQKVITLRYTKTTDKYL